MPQFKRLQRTLTVAALTALAVIIVLWILYKLGIDLDKSFSFELIAGIIFPSAVAYVQYIRETRNEEKQKTDKVRDSLQDAINILNARSDSLFAQDSGIKDALRKNLNEVNELAEAVVNNRLEIAQLHGKLDGLIAGIQIGRKIERAETDKTDKRKNPTE